MKSTLEKLESITKSLLNGEKIKEEDHCTEEELKLCQRCDHLEELKELTIALSGKPIFPYKAHKARVRAGRNKNKQDDK